MKKGRKKKYMLFLYGEWKTLAKITKEVSEIMKPVMESKYLKFIYGERSLIAHFKSYETLEEIKTYLDISFGEEVTAFFLIPKPRKIGYRLDNDLEEHLFKLDKNTDPYFKYENPPTEESYPSDTNRVPKLDDILFNGGISKLFKEFGEWEDRLTNKDNWDPEEKEYDLDTILEKISENGKESLTKVELKFLKNYGKK
tara:strand:+ start:622 stop:1215 length:594 start_codon:yes stop_codon:yes gene_type:complete